MLAVKEYAENPKRVGNHYLLKTIIMITLESSTIAKTTLYRFGNAEALQPGQTQTLVCQYADVPTTAFAVPSVCDNANASDYSLEILSWNVQNVSGAGSMSVTVKNVGNSVVYPAVSILFAVQS